MPRPGMPAQELRSYSLSNRDPVTTVEQRGMTLPGLFLEGNPRSRQASGWEVQGLRAVLVGACHGPCQPSTEAGSETDPQIPGCVHREQGLSMQAL